MNAHQKLFEIQVAKLAAAAETQVQARIKARKVEIKVDGTWQAFTPDEVIDSGYYHRLPASIKARVRKWTYGE